MEDHDDFQLIDMGFDMDDPITATPEPVLVSAPPDEIESKELAINTVSQLASMKYDVDSVLQEIKVERSSLALERKTTKKLQNQLSKKISQYDSEIAKQIQIFKTFQSKISEVDQMKIQMKKELDKLKKLRVSLQEERTIMKVDSEKTKKELEKIKKDSLQLNTLIRTHTKCSQQQKKTMNVQETINKLIRETKEASKDIHKLREIRKNQEKLLTEFQIEIETIHKNQSEIGQKDTDISAEIGDAESLKELECSKAYSCKNCGTHISLEDNIESRCYQVGQGRFSEKKRGFLFSTACNLSLGTTKTETFTTGSYEISWVSCQKCSEEMGWKYLSADTPNNIGKVDKYCLARYKLTSPEDRNEV